MHFKRLAFVDNWSIKKGWIAILLLTLLCHLGVAAFTKSWIFPSDHNFWCFGYEMGQIAASLAMGNGFSWPEWGKYPTEPTAWMAPIPPLIMAGAFKVFGLFNPQAAIALEIFLSMISALTCVFLYLLGKRLYNAHIELLAAFLLAIYPASIFYAVRSLWHTTLLTCCLLAIIFSFLKLAENPNPKIGAWLGLLLGFTALVNPIVVGTYPLVFVWLYLTANSSRGTLMKTILSTLIVCCLVISPWLWRNYIVFGQVTFIKSNFGHELYLGTTNTLWDDKIRLTNDEPVNNALTETDRDFLKQANEPTRNAFLLRKGLGFIMEHPAHFAQQVLGRFIRLWTFMRPQRSLEANVSLVVYFMVLILAVAGITLSSMKRLQIQLVLLVLLLIPMPYYLTIATIFRYRFPIEPILVIFASNVIYKLAMCFSLRVKGLDIRLAEV